MSAKDDIWLMIDDRFVAVHALGGGSVEGVANIRVLILNVNKPVHCQKI